MRRFHSYEEVDPNLHYYVPREALIAYAYHSLLGQNPESGGHYITVWGPRQSGKSWVMRQTIRRLAAKGDFEVAILTMQSGQMVQTDEEILKLLQNFFYDYKSRVHPEFPTGNGKCVPTGTTIS